MSTLVTLHEFYIVSLPRFIAAHPGEVFDTSKLCAVEGVFFIDLDAKAAHAFEERLKALGCVPVPGSELPPVEGWPTVCFWLLPGVVLPVSSAPVEVERIDVEETGFSIVDDAEEEPIGVYDEIESGPAWCLECLGVSL